MKVKPKMVKDMVGVVKNSPITHHIKELGKMIILMEEVSLFMVVVLVMKVNSKTKNIMEVVFLYQRIKNFDMKVNLKIMRRMDMGCRFKRIYQNIGDFFKIR
jgi:hypothetical protein